MNAPIPLQPCAKCGKPADETQSVYGVMHYACYKSHNQPVKSENKHG